MTELTKTLDVQADNLSQLKVLLEKELELISSRDAEALILLVKDKEVLLDQVQEVDAKINQLYLALDGKIPEVVTEQIDHIKNLLDECKYKTAVSQKAVEQGQLRLEHLRNLLVQSRTKESMTYDKSGKASGLSKGKGISA
jgi:flagella synthesis protein FlgN